jgi:plasmid stabilization system protein ParE
MNGPHENLEHAEHAQHASHANKKIALLISVLALFLAFSEMLGKGAQTDAISENVASSNLWSFFQAKTIRITILNAAAERLELVATTTSNPDTRAQLEKSIQRWKATAARYEDEPSTGEGRKQLSERARKSEHKRDLALARYHHYEMASAAYQIGIVLASAEVITAMAALGWAAGLAGVIGVAFTAIGLWAPHAVHLFG